MKKLLLIFIMVQTLALHGQLPANSLKNICVSSYNSSYSEEYKGVVAILNDYPEAYAHLEKPGIGTEELFTGYFQDFRIYSIFYKTPSIQAESIWCPMLYAIDANTGNFVNFKDTEDFNRFIQSSTKAIVNLDKAYLCLYFMMHFPKWKMITLPERYSKFNAKSVFYDKQDFVRSGYPFSDEIFSSGKEEWGETENSDINTSSDKNIYVYAGMYWQEPYGIRYHFTFDDCGNLGSAIADTLGVLPKTGSK